jgi:hypothetical protein
MKLYSPDEIQPSQPDFLLFKQVMTWVETFLGRPNPNLGRPGSVCPFVPRALQLDTIRLGIVRSHGLSAAQIEEMVKGYRDYFLTMEPSQGDLAVYKAILLVFPDVEAEEAPELIDGVQQKLKPFFVEEGLMLGEFHSYNQSPGLHNPDFRPLRSPVPMLAIRFMAESDLPFLSRANDAPAVRIRYLEAYLKRWADSSSEAQLRRARQFLAQAYAQQPQPQKCPFARVLRLGRSLKQKLRSLVPSLL